jgi:hypothetical protein
MQNEVIRIIRSMDVRLNREDAESKAFSIYKMGPDVLGILVAFGKSVKAAEPDMEKKRKLLRAVILAIGTFARKRIFMKPRIFSNSNAISLLCELAADGYQSAGMVLHNIGFSDLDIERARLMSLPIVERLFSDREISVNEALQEIKIAVLQYRHNTIRQNAYLVGYSRKHAHEIYRIGENDFVYRIRRRR